MKCQNAREIGRVTVRIARMTLGPIALKTSIMPNEIAADCGEAANS